jgi:hypothetical protein
MIIVKQCKSIWEEYSIIDHWQVKLKATFGGKVDERIYAIERFADIRTPPNQRDDRDSIRRQYVDLTGDLQEKQTIIFRSGRGWKLINSAPAGTNIDSHTVYLHFDDDNDAVLFKLTCL